MNSSHLSRYTKFRQSRSQDNLGSGNGEGGSANGTQIMIFVRQGVTEMLRGVAGDVMQFMVGTEERMGADTDIPECNYFRHSAQRGDLNPVGHFATGPKVENALWELAYPMVARNDRICDTENCVGLELMARLGGTANVEERWESGTDTHVGVIGRYKTALMKEPEEEAITRANQETDGDDQRWGSQRDIESVDRIKEHLAYETDWLILSQDGEIWTNWIYLAPVGNI